MAAMQEVARREAQEIERIERAAMGGMLVSAEPYLSDIAGVPPADSASASRPQLEAAAAPAADPTSAPADQHAEGLGAAAAQPPAEPEAALATATAAAEADALARQLHGRIAGVPSVPCFHAFIHAHAAAGDLRSA